MLFSCALLAAVLAAPTKLERLSKVEQLADKIVREQGVQETACKDSNEDARDRDGDSCKGYKADWCGAYDTDDFHSRTMCCACGGGVKTDESAACGGDFYNDWSERHEGKSWMQNYYPDGYCAFANTADAYSCNGYNYFDWKDKYPHGYCVSTERKDDW